MLTLSARFKYDLETLESPNLCRLFSPADLASIGIECYEGYARDKTSRSAWERRNEAGMDLALQIVQDKNFPWAGCSNIKFPLVTIAAMQFHARAYPAILNGGELVNCQIFGDDPQGVKKARSDRISTNMSWQLSYQDRSWKEQTDKALFNLSIVGTNFKKSRRDTGKGHNVSELVLAKNLFVDYWAKSLEDCPRKTHIIPMFRNEIRERVLRGTFRDVLEEAWFKGSPTPPTTAQQAKQDNRQGLTPPMPDWTTAFQLGEQHVFMDLDGDDYAEPYLITFDLVSKSVLRIVAAVDRLDEIDRVSIGKYAGKIISTKPAEYFTKYTFIPSPDGGFYDLGFGVLLGPLNEATNSLINQIADAGTMSNSGGGFLGRGAKLRGGAYTFAPLEWKRVDCTGDDLRKSIYPLDIREPSAVLFQLLSLLINYTNRVSGATDMMVGENPGQNTPAETSRTMVEMGQKLYTAIFQRVWSSMGNELHKLYKLNGKFMEDEAKEPGGATREDYLGEPDVVPAADPNITSDVLQMQQATAVKQSAMTTPGYDKDEVERRWLKSMKVSNIDGIFPGAKGQEGPQDPRITVAQMKLKGDQMKLAAAREEFVIELLEERRVNNATILKLMAEAEEAQANAASEASYARVASINAAIAAVKTQNEHISGRIDQMLKLAELEIKKDEAKEPANASA